MTLNDLVIPGITLFLLICAIILVINSSADDIDGSWPEDKNDD